MFGVVEKVDPEKGKVTIKAVDGRTYETGMYREPVTSLKKGDVVHIGQPLDVGVAGDVQRVPAAELFTDIGRLVITLLITELARCERGFIDQEEFIPVTDEQALELLIERAKSGHVQPFRPIIIVSG